MEHKPYAPGQHGQSRQRKPSDYKRQLLEKQRLRFQYNVSERQMSNYFSKAASSAGVTSDTLVRLLETRLDAIVYRASFATTIYAARQYVNHGHILVNGKAVNIPSYQLKAGDVVSLKPNSALKPFVQTVMKTATPPAYLSTDPQQLSARLVHLPVREEVPVICEVPLVVEYYSR
jgi:small subunit ribosomal protein S4